MSLRPFVPVVVSQQLEKAAEAVRLNDGRSLRLHLHALHDALVDDTRAAANHHNQRALQMTQGECLQRAWEGCREECRLLVWPNVV